MEGGRGGLVERRDEVVEEFKDKVGPKFMYIFI